MDFYDKLFTHKALKKLSWKEIGDKINKEEATIRIAITRKSLSELEKRELENHFLNEKADNTLNEPNVSYSSLTNEEIKEIVYKVATNEERFMQEKIFSNIIELRVAKKIGVILSNEEEYKKWRNS